MVCGQTSTSLRKMSSWFKSSAVLIALTVPVSTTTKALRSISLSLLSRESSCSVQCRWFPSPWATMCSQPGAKGLAGAWPSPPWPSSPATWATCSSHSKAHTKRWDQCGFNLIAYSNDTIWPVFCCICLILARIMDSSYKESRFIGCL